MPFDIENHRLVQAVSKPSPNVSGRIDPKFVVLHYTAGPTAQSAIDTFTSPSSRVSAHITIGEDAKVYQHAPLNVRTWHAGPSQHMGYSGLNGHSIGIEIVNVGWLLDEGDKYARRNAAGKIVAELPKTAKGILARHPRVGGKTYFWPEYTEKQLEVVADVVEAIVEEYSIIDIVSHEEIDTRGWKTDPGPAFPMEGFKRILFSSPHRDLDTDRYVVTASSLNVRSGPGPDFGVIGSQSRDAVVSDMGRHEAWVRISEDGWVHSAYLRRIM